MPKRIDSVEIGTKMNHLEIIDSEIIRKGHNIYIKCRCDCGKEISTSYSNFKSGHTKQCRRCGDDNNIKHGLCDHRLYSIFQGMIQRCYNPNSQQYKWYGLCGVTIYSEWRNDFKTFYEWSMNNGYDDHLTIDRIESTGNYEPGNVRWVTTQNQSYNRRGKLNNVTSKYKGVCYSSRDKIWTAQIQADNQYHRLGSFQTEKEAALAYNEAAKLLHKEYAYLNVIEDTESEEMS